MNITVIADRNGRCGLDNELGWYSLGALSDSHLSTTTAKIDQAITGEPRIVCDCGR
ncbi:MAG TPA: hypothetical protein VK436_11025 [Methanocella sp.]|nr:hypothetical protein [Methanocella sp.]